MAPRADRRVGPLTQTIFGEAVMEILVGIGLGLATAVFTTLAGFERGRVLYPVMLVVIASYYELFAAMGEPEAIGAEAALSAAFIALAVIGFQTNLWIVAAALLAHGVSDIFHGQIVTNTGVPLWWPGFCGSIDATFAVWLAWRLSSGAIDAQAPESFGALIKPQVDAELRAATLAERSRDFTTSFHHLERAHVLGQISTIQHVRVHVRMLFGAIRRFDAHEAVGQLLRIVGAATKTAFGLVPHGNTGGAKVSPFRPMPIPEDLADRIRAARSPASVALSVVLLSATLGLGACASAPPDDVRHANADGHRVAYRVLGSGAPAIVMIAGLGYGMETFSEVALQLAHNATVIVYDRAGYGDSDTVAGWRDAAAAERELSALLSLSGVQGPYVLVGHSLGGLFAEYYAARHPDQIAGLILEDSRPSVFARRCAAAGIDMCVPAPLAMKLSPVGAQQEAAALTRTEAEVDAVRVATDVPVLILSRGVKSDASAFERTWNLAQSHLAERYSGAVHLRAPSSGHDIHHGSTDWYVAAIRRFLELPAE